MDQKDSKTTAPIDNVLIDDVADWLMTKALQETSVEEVFLGCCERLYAAGVPVYRGHIGFRTLHPLFRAITLIWRRGQELEVVEHPHGPISEAFLQGPHHHMIERDIPLLRRKLEGEAVTLDFPVLNELRQEGATDYLAYMIPFGEPKTDLTRRDGIIGSWTSHQPGGFSDADIRLLRRIQRRLAVACKVSIKNQIARNILDAYLGQHTGKMVYEGSISRGSGERVHAVIMFSDLRGSTALSKELSTEEFLKVLNEFFESVADVVLDRGGEVLRFIGDAMLAIFPMSNHGVGDPTKCPIHQATCETALAAARDAIDRMAELNARRIAGSKEPLGYGIGLHVGDVMYGNIGVPRRVEFSVVGLAANYAAKIETLCKTLDVPMVVSQQFADIRSQDWVDLGEHEMADTGRYRIYTLSELMDAEKKAKKRATR